MAPRSPGKLELRLAEMGKTNGGTELFWWGGVEIRSLSFYIVVLRGLLAIQEVRS